jgi:PAS domain S-box-containing protein
MKVLEKRAASRRMKGRYSSRLSDKFKGGRHRSFRGVPEFFRLAVESLSEYALLTTGKDLLISSWSGPAAAIFGYKESEIIGQSVSCLFTPEDVASGIDKRAFDEALKKGRQVAERWHVRKDGRRFWCYSLSFPLKDEKGVVRGFVHLIRDDTSRKEKDDLLHESEARLSLAAESTGLGTWDYDVAKKSLTLSKRAAELFDLEAEPKAAFYYEHFFKMIHDEDRARISQEFDHCLSPNSKCAEEMEFRIHRRDGDIRWVLTRAQAFVDGPGGKSKPNRLIGTVVDITDRRRRQREAKEAKLAADQTQERATEELIAAELLARSTSIALEVQVEERAEQLTIANKELEAFNYSVSHDLRAPLRSIAGFSAILRTTYQEKLNDSGKSYLRRIELATQEMSALIDAMMSLSRATLADVVWEELDLSELALQVGSELREAEPKRQVRLLIEPDMKATGDKALLEIALRCLLNNAWKFTARRPAASIEVGSVREGASAAYFVRDNGVGFEQAYAHKMFQPFQRLHAKEGFTGTGIGLTLVSRVVERHGGRVWAESKPGKGSTFYFTLGRRPA